jgi:hypothetical protein
MYLTTQFRHTPVPVWFLWAIVCLVSITTSAAVTVTTAALPGQEVHLSPVSPPGVTRTWEAQRTVSGANDGDYRVAFLGVDQDGYTGDGESTLRVQDPPQAPAFSYPTEPLTRTTAGLEVRGWAQPFTTLRLYESGVLVETLGLGSVGQWVVPLTLGEGTHAITATATDGLGQVSPEGRAGLVVVDSVPPTASLEPLPAYHSVHTVTLHWGGEDPAPGTGVASYDVQQRAGGGAWQTILAGTVLAATTRWLDEGVYGFQVRARDGAGNLGGWSAEVSTWVDTISPTVSLDVAAGAGAIAVTWDASDTGSGLDTCVLEVREGQGE